MLHKVSLFTCFLTSNFIAQLGLIETIGLDGDNFDTMYFDNYDLPHLTEIGLLEYPGSSEVMATPTGERTNSKARS